MSLRCFCACHWPPDVGFFIGVNTERDAVAAVTACPVCLDAHCPVLLERRIWWEDAPPPVLLTAPPAPAEAATDTGEGDEA